MQELEYGTASYELSIPGQNRPMVIVGPSETIVEHYNQAEAYQQAETVRRATRATRAAKMAVESVAAPTHGVMDNVKHYIGGIALDVRTALYDRMNGTHFYDAIQERRQLKRDLAFAQKIGLVAVEPCQKHKHKGMECAKYREGLQKIGAYR